MKRDIRTWKLFSLGRRGTQRGEPVTPSHVRRGAWRVMGAAALLVTTACAGGTRVLEPGLSAQLDSAFKLRVGQEASVEGQAVQVQLVAVPEDSRCPTDVVCVWAGDARVQLRVRQADDERKLDLHTQLDPRSAEVGGYRITLISLEPFPTSGGPIPANQYRAEVRVNRVP